MDNSKKHSYKDWFEFNAREQRGILTLIVLLFALIFIHFSIGNFVSTNNGDFAEGKKEIDAWFLNVGMDSSFGFVNEVTEKTHRTSTPHELFDFDPNTATSDEWKLLGMGPGQIKSIFNFLSKGGKFRVRSDLSKMYVIDASKYAELEPYILLPETIEKKANWKTQDWNIHLEDSTAAHGHNEYRQKLSIELNSADTLELRKLNGIGPYLSRKIVEYRNRLGGFRSIDQLTEIYRMTPGKVDSIAPFITLDESLIHFIDLNEVTESELMMHPYLTKTQVRAMISYRDKHGPFKKVDDLKGCLSIDEKTFEKIKFYLQVR